MALYFGNAFCRRRQCCRSAGTCHSKACNISELSGAVHDGSCCRFAAASVPCIQVRGWSRFPVGETNLQFVSISGLSVEIHTTGKASRNCCNENDKSGCLHAHKQNMHIPFEVRAGMWSDYFYSEVRYRFSSGSNYSLELLKCLSWRKFHPWNTGIFPETRNSTQVISLAGPLMH